MSYGPNKGKRGYRRTVSGGPTAHEVEETYSVEGSEVRAGQGEAEGEEDKPLVEGAKPAGMAKGGVGS